MSNDAAFTVRPAAPGDAGLLSELAMRSKAHWGYSAAFMEACRAELELSPQQINDGKFTAELACNGEHVTGFFAVEQLSREEFELAALFVEPAWIGRGAGRTLMQRVFEIVRANGGARLVIQGDPHAERFYLAAGCRRAGERESGSVPGRMLPLFVVEF